MKLQRSSNIGLFLPTSVRMGWCQFERDFVDINVAFLIVMRQHPCMRRVKGSQTHHLLCRFWQYRYMDAVLPVVPVLLHVSDAER
jgi:hypothetical protein